MLDKGKSDSTKYILAIHSTKDFFGFAYKYINDQESDEIIFIKKFNRDLSNNLIIDLAKFLPESSFDYIERITISSGPANFNATRLIVVLARSISQQIKCPLDHYSCYRIMAKRIASKNNIFKANQDFWIINNLKNKGYIAGKYSIDKNRKSHLAIKEVVTPKLYKTIDNKKLYYEVDYDIHDDLRELIRLSLENHKESKFASWKDVLPIYPISPVN